MVLQDTIDNLRDRPHHERHTIALFASIFVVVILLIGWAFFFFRDFDGASVQQIQDTYDKAVQNVAPPDTTGWVSEPTTETPTEVPTQTRQTGSVGGIQFIEESATTTESTDFLE